MNSKFKHCFRLLIIILIMFPLALLAQVDDEFWFVAPDIAASHGDNPIFMRISAMENETEITLRMPANPSFTPITQTIAPNTTFSIGLTPWLNIIENTPADQVLNRGLLLVADNDVTAYYECAHTNNPGIFSLKGKNALGNEFYIVSQNTYYNQVGQESFEIVATEDNTTITITPSDDIIGHNAGETFVIILNRGETYSCRATNTNAPRTLNGSYITSDKPIAVTWQDDSIFQGGAYDIVCDQTIPTNILGMEYIAISGWANANEHIYVCGTVDNTDIYINGNAIPAATINASGLFSYQIPTTDNTVFLEASAPVYVLHLSGYNNEFGASILPQDSCTGSDQIGFNRTNNNTFALLILTRNGNQDSFVLNGSTTIISGADFDVVPGTNDEWVYSKRQFTTAEIPVGPNSISNTIGKFHLGVLHQTGASAEYGFFSDYSSLYLGADANICPGDSMLLDGGSNMTSYEWYKLINNAWTLVDTNRYYTVLDSGFYSCVVNGNYCTLMDTINIGMYPMATADLGPDTSICEGNAVTLDPGIYVSYLWNTGATTSTITVNSTGAYWVEVVNNNGCVAHDTVNVTVNPLPVPTIIGSDSACANNSEYLYTTQAGMSAYTWGISSGGTIISGSGSDTVSVIWNSSGSQSISINYTNENGCTADNSTVFNVMVMPQAFSDAGSNEAVCQYHEWDFNNSEVLPDTTNADSLLWFGGTGTFNFDTALTPVYTPAAGELGIVRLWLVAYGKQPCSNDTSYMDLTIFDGPEAGFTITPGDSLCAMEAITFQDTSTTTIIDWQWNFGDGNTSTLAAPSHFYTTSGIYTVKLLVENTDGCLDSIQQAIEVFPLPVAGFEITPGNAVCDGTLLTFTDTTDQGTGAIQQRYWDLGDGTTNNGTSFTHTYPGPGTYIVSMHVYNENSCRDTMTQVVNIYQLPQCDFTVAPNDTTCINEAVTFSGIDNSGTGIINWFWDFGDGGTSNIQSPTYTFTNTGTWQVKLVVTNADGCQDSITYPHYVLQPALSLNADLNPSCATYPINFTGNVAGNYTFDTFEWDFGDGNTASGQNVTHAYATAGTYTVTLSYCTSSITLDVLVYPQPIAFAGSDTMSCEDVPFDLGTLALPPDTFNAVSLEWFGGAGTFSNRFVLHPVYTPADNEYNQTVTLYLVAYGNGPCDPDTSSMDIYIDQGAYAFAGSDEDHCQDEVYDFHNSTQVPDAWNEAFRLWTHNGLGTIPDPTDSIPTYIPAPGETGQITFTLTAWNILNCDSLDEMVLTIHPTYYEVVYDTICWGDSLLLPGGSWAYTGGLYIDTLMSVWNCDSVIGTELYQHPMIDADFSMSPRDTNCLGEEVFFTKTGTATLVNWIWDFGDGNTTSTADPVHIYNNPGTYTVTYSYTDIYGCTDEKSHDVSVFEYPDVDFTSSALSACINAEFIFNGFSSDNIIAWDWDFGDGTTGTGQNVSHIYNTYGPLAVTLTITADNLCQNSITKSIFVAAPPEADFTHNIVSCDTIQFTDLSTAPQGYFLVEWAWDFGDGTTSNLQHPSHAFGAGGVYTVELVVTADSAGLQCTDTVSKPVLVPGMPTVYFSWTPEPTCLGGPTQFFGTSGSPVTEWYWDFGDGGFSYLQNPSHTYTVAGTYTVTLAALDANGCSNTVTHQVNVSDIPDVSFTVNPNPGCAGEPISFDGSSTSNVTSWLWNFGDGGQSINQSPTHVFASPGTYSVTLWVGDTANCFNSANQLVTVNPMPLALFTTGNSSTCSSDTVFFYNQSVSPNGNIIEWVWDFGDGNTATVNAPGDPDVFHIYATGGTYNVTLTVLDEDSCSDSYTLGVTITTGPLADFNYVDNCAGQPMEFLDISSPNSGSPIVSWYWEFDDPASGALNTSVLQNPVHLFTAAGTYDVLLAVENVDGCSDTTILPVSVDVAPLVSFTTDSDSACVDQDMNFYGQANTSVTWSWDFGDGGSSVLQDPVHVYGAPGTYTVTVSVEDAGGCTAEYSSNVYINPLPIADFAFNPPLCSGTPVSFTDLSSPMNSYMVSWHWYFGDGTDTVLYAPGPGDVTHTYASPGNYTVSLAIDNGFACEDSVSYELSVLQGPEAAFEHSGDVCEGGTVQFTDLSLGFGSTIQTWLWQFGDPASGANNTSVLQNPTHIYSTAGTYVVSLTVTANTGCQHTTEDTIEIAPPPPLDWYTNPDTNCYNTPTYFFTDPAITNISEVVQYAWNFGDPASGASDTSSLQNPVHLYTAPGTYLVTLAIVNVDGCENSITHMVEVNAPPVADFDHEQACLGDSTLFTDQSIAQGAAVTSWLWDFGDPASGASNTSILQNTGHVFSGLGTYNVQLIATDYSGCVDTIVKILVVDNAPAAHFTYNQPCDPPGYIYFSDSSWTQTGSAPITAWLWELEPGQFSTEINPTYTFTQFDTCYVVSLTVTDANGCSHSFEDSVCVFPPLVASLEVSRVCQGDSTLFVAGHEPASDTIVSCFWDFGDGTQQVNTADTVYYVYGAAGTYYATLTMVNQNGCEQTLLRTVTVDALPQVDFSASPALCDAPTVFTDLSSPGSGAAIVSWLWNFGDTASGDLNISEEKSPSHLYAMIDSSYVVTLVVTNSLGCVDSLAQVMEKGLCLNAQFEVLSDTACRLTQICFADSSYILGDAHTIQLWHWDFGDGQQQVYSSFTPQVCHTYAARGTYSVSLVVSTAVDGRYYADTMLRQVSVSALPEAAMAVQAPCAGDRASFFDMSADNGVEISTWAWDFGDPFFANDTSSLQNPTYVYGQTGTYRVQLITTNVNGCSDTVTQDIEVFNSPVAVISSSLACAGGLTLFTDESTPADGELSSWLWSFDDGETSSQQHPRHVFADTGSFLVRMVVTDENLCKDTASHVVSVFPAPLSAFSIVDRYEKLQGQVLLDNLSVDAVRYLWHFGNGDSSENFSPVVRYEDNGTYLIQLIAWNDNNCPDTAHMEYTIIFQGLYVPTGFTPDSPNEALAVFKPVGLNLEFYELVIVNQRGNTVFRSNKLDENGSPLEGWDGSTNGEPQPTGNYMWSISARFKDGSVWTGNNLRNGDNLRTFGKVLLIR